MTGFPEYDDYDGLGLAGLVRDGDVSPRELLEAAIDRIERRDPEINAVVTRMYDLARATVANDLPGGPFKGVPFLLKDLSSHYAGVPFTKGCRALEDFVPGSDSELVKRFKAAGVVTVGKTNTPEFGLTGVTEPELFGPTRTPWDTNHTAGGSSGGSGAAVAARLTPIASAGDGGGSIRIPASCCGIFGLKPSRGRTPRGPDGEGWQGAVVDHILSRSVRDSAAMLDAIQGADPGAPFIVAPPRGSYLDQLDREPGRLRIAFSSASPLDTPVHADCVAAVADAAALLTDLGHHCEEAAPDYDGQALAQAYFMLYFGEVAAEIDGLEAILGRKPRRADVETVTWTLGLLGRVYSAADFVKSRARWNDFARAMGAFHQRYDVYLTPTIAVPPPAIGETRPAAGELMLLRTINRFGLGRLLKISGVAADLAQKSLAKMPFTQAANLTGQPAMSVPLYWNDNGLPCGVQFIAPIGDEVTLFRLAAQLERARPWADRRPPGF